MHPAIINNPAFSLKAELSLPADKSISHRAVLISAIANGKTAVNNFLFSDDSIATIDALRKLGIKITADKKNKEVVIYGKGLRGLSCPNSPLYLKESGTTMRLLAGVLAGQKFTSLLTAGRTLLKRPMRRITVPLRLMGAKINSKFKRPAIAGTPNAKLEEYPPLEIKGGNLKAITYKMPLSSAQVKSAILFAGLYAEGETRVSEPIKTRDHTEKMLKLFRADIRIKGLETKIKQSNLFSPKIIDIPADISSAAFFIVLAALLPRSRILIKSVGLNPTRTGIIGALKQMGAKIKVSKCQSVKVSKFEPIGDIIARSSVLNGIVIKKDKIPSLIDELPIFMVAASLARGKTVIEGVSELRVKETDRINSMLNNLKKMGANIKVRNRRIKGKIEECLEINGVEKLKGRAVKSYGDHRTAMSMIISGLLAEGKTRLDDIECINKSFPEFISLVKHLLGRDCINFC